MDTLSDHIYSYIKNQGTDVQRSLLKFTRKYKAILKLRTVVKREGGRGGISQNA